MASAAYWGSFLHWVRIRTCTTNRLGCEFRWRCQSYTWDNRHRTLHTIYTHQRHYLYALENTC